MSDVIAVTGASGQLGRRLVRHLTEAGVAVRLVVRDPARTPQIPGAQVAVAAYEDERAMVAALDGVGTVFLVSAHEDRNRVQVHRKAVAAVAAAGVERVVYTSFMGAAPNSTFTYARDHALTERMIAEAGLALTALRSSLYADVAPLFVGSDGTMRGPGGDGRVAWVAREDVTRLAAAVLVDAGHANQTYDVSGPEAITMTETARLLTGVTGRPIGYVPETIEEARASRAGAGEPWQIEGWVSSYYAVATGETSVTSHTVEHVTGVRPWTFAEFLHNEPESWAHLAH